MILYFSSTGNSKLLAENLALFTNDTAYNLVDITTTHTEKILSHTPRLGFVFPTYGWDMPVIVSSFFKKIKDLHVNSNFIYVVVTCGDDVGFIDRKINKLFRNSNIKIDAFFSICMPNTYVCVPGFDVDNDKVRRKKLSAFKHCLADIVSNIKSQNHTTRLKRGLFPFTKTYILGLLFKKILLTDKYFHTTEDCISCKKCENVCPNHNILFKNNRPEWQKNCIGCLSCYHHCPTKAIRFGHQTDHKGQYLITAHLNELNPNDN